MNASRVKQVKKEYLVKKNPKLINKIKEYIPEEKMKEMDLRGLFKMIKNLWNQKIITKENII